MIKSSTSPVRLFKGLKEGFTLLELIAVLIIVGLLAYIALPRYTSIQDEAKNRVTAGALSSATGEAQLRYANLLLSSDGAAVSMNDLAATLSASSTLLGDYQFTYASTENGIMVTVQSVNGKTDGLGTPTSKFVRIR